MEKSQHKYVIAFDSGAKGTRYHSLFSSNGVSYPQDAEHYESEEEAQEVIDKNKWICWIEEFQNI